MERETVSFELPVSKRTVKIKSWMTAREKRQVQDVYLAETSFKGGGGDDSTFELKGALMNKAQDVTLSVMIVSIDDKTENLLEEVLDLRTQDFDFLIKKINEVTEESGGGEENKKK